MDFHAELMNPVERLVHWQRRDFDSLYTTAARADFDIAVVKLYKYWRRYRVAYFAPTIRSPLYDSTFVARYKEYQAYSYYKADKIDVSTFDRICTLDLCIKYVPALAHFERRLLKDVVAMFLLPALVQHTPYYGYSGRSNAASIDCSHEQDKIDGKVCTAYELYAHNNPIVHADELLDDGWDYDSADDDEFTESSDEE
jgi:hypothetical protein